MWTCYVSSLIRPVVHNRRRFAVRLLSSGSSETLTTLDVGSHQSELVVKKSQFIGYAQHVETWKEAQDYLDVVRAEHPKARHVCFGFVAGVNPVQERCSDDGEPTGTAGVPILAAIKGGGLSDTMCIVVRYFGGIKLGAGGLIRAYGGGARQVLREAGKKVLIPKSSIRVSVPSSFVGSVYDSASKVGGIASEETYDAVGNLSVTITVETKNESQLRETLTDATRGEAQFVEERE